MRGVLEFVKKVGSGFDLTTEQVRIGVKSSCADASVSLSGFSDVSAFSSSIDGAISSSLGQLLQNVRTMFGVNRPNANRVSIILLSGQISDMKEAIEQARRLKFKSRVIFIAIGGAVTEKDLMPMASFKNSAEPDSSHIFSVKSAKELVNVVKKIHVLICREQ